MTSLRRVAAAAITLVCLSLPAIFPANAQDKTIVGNDLPASFTPPARTPYKAPAPTFDYVKRVEMIPMRDGTKLYTVIVIPNGAKNAPIVMTRTCYNAAARASAQRTTAGPALPGAVPPGRPGAMPKNESPHMLDELGLPDEVFVKAGYIRIYQDVRGKYGSEGVYLMTPPPVGPYNPSGADDTTDAYDTIDWLVKNVHESNGRVGMIGSSYEGFTVVMALLNPHPALKAAIPESPMVDGWMGDDWFHYGAFRQPNLDYFVGQTSARGAGPSVSHGGYDDYSNFLAIGSAGDFARFMGEEQLPYWKTVEAHPSYDGFWQSQALDKLVAQRPLTVPTLWLQGLWDQEDMYGANHAYKLWESKDTHNDMNFLLMGPWYHSQINREGHTMGPFTWDGDTTADVRQDVFMPFFNQYLVEGAPKANTPPVLIYNTAENHWDKFNAWPQSCDKGCPATSKPLYLTANSGLSFEAPTASTPKSDEYLSDPAHPVPYRPRPVGPERTGWTTWLVQDQRFADGRPDVLTYMTEPLTAPLRVSGVPEVNLVASTTGTDSDWVVKLIDVYPDDPNVAPGGMNNGYQLPISLDIFRGRYRKSFEHPEPIKVDEPLTYKFDLPNVNHIFAPGHRIMVQIQSTLFPLYDRNPQTYVPNIFNAKPADYKKATQRIFHTPGKATFINLPVVP